MKTIFTLAVVAFLLLITASPGFALRQIATISRQDAKEMGLEVRTQGNGPQVWVELEFRAQDKLKDFRHVELEIHEGDKLLVGYAPLREERLESGRILARFLADRAYLDKITLTVVVGDFEGVGYEVRVRDFVGLKKDR